MSLCYSLPQLTAAAAAAVLPGLWERAFCATEASLEQLDVIEQVLQQVVPRMEQLEADRQELAACINSVKALTLREQTAHAKAVAQQLVQQEEEQQRQQQQQEHREQQQVGRVGASRAAGLRRAAVEQVAAVTAAAGATPARVKEEQPAAHATMNGWLRSSPAAVQPTAKQEPAAAAAGYYTSLLQQALQTVAPPASALAANGVTDGSSTHSQVDDDSSGSSSIANAASLSTSSLRYMRGTCKEMVADMDWQLLKWRTLSGARSAVTFALRSEQIAAMLLAAFPYMPMMGCMCDYVPAARAAALQRAKLQAVQQQEARQQQQ
jgi:chemotaxis protein histidine kinase CheA